MKQLFPRSANYISKASIVIGGLVAVTVFLAGNVLVRSSYFTQIGVAREQPVMFSHKHHVQGLGLDCRYCHTTVDESAFAGIPPTETCMTCHSQIWTEAPMLEPVRESWKTGKPLEWVRVHDAPDFVFFDHSIHVNKGVSCKTCHGRVDEMPLVRKNETLQMEWCLTCHFDPEKFIQPKETVYDMDYERPADHDLQAILLMEEYGIQKEQLTNCSICHR